MEIWKSIDGYEGLYEISDHGNVKSLRKNIIMKPFDNKGYLRIGLYKNGEVEKKLVHVLVAEHFVSERPNGQSQVNHKDLNKMNNHYDNLEWVSGKENVNHCLENMNGKSQKLKKDMSGIGKEFGHLGVEASKKPVAKVDKETLSVISIYESAREACKEGFNYRNISQVCNGEKKTHRGYIWKFI